MRITTYPLESYLCEMHRAHLLEGLRRRWDRRVLAARLHWLQGRIHPDPRRALLLFASPRGGSTWLEEMIAQVPRVATLWEPLDIERNPIAGRLGFWWRQHIPEDADWPEAHAMFEDLFSGRTLSPYLARATTLEQLRAADRLLVKFVRGNLLLPYIARQFNVPPPVLLVRHPCAVVASMKTYGLWNDLGEPSAPPHRFDHVYRTVIDKIGPVRSEAAHMAKVWCITNAWILEHEGTGKDWQLVTYEDLVLDTRRTLNGIFTKWGIDPSLMTNFELNRPSKTALQKAPISDPMDQITAWKRTLRKDEINDILDVLNRCEVKLYNEDVLPTYDQIALTRKK